MLSCRAARATGISCKRSSPNSPNVAIKRSREPDKTWRDFVDTWIDWNRGLGRLRHMVIVNLTTVGVSEADIPPQVTF